MNLKIEAFDKKSEMNVYLTEVNFVDQKCKYLPIGTNPAIAEIITPQPIDNLKDICIIVDGKIVWHMEKL